MEEGDVKTVSKTDNYTIKNEELSEKGEKEISWAEQHMPVVSDIKEDFESEKPLKGLNIGCCLHVTKETAVLMKTLKAGGASVALCGSNPLSTDDAVAASLVKDGIKVFAWRGLDEDEYFWCIDQIIDSEPNITMDDGGDFTARIHTSDRVPEKDIIGGTEETTTGINRIESMSKKGVLNYPVIAVNDTMTKYLFDNRYGTGQSTIEGIIRAGSTLIAGKTFVVCGYGWCGRGIAMRAEGFGAKVIVTEVDPIKALEAAMNGYRVMPIEEAAKKGDIFVSATGNKHVIGKKALENMKDGAMLANSGHFDIEIDIDYLNKIAERRTEIKPNVKEYKTKDGRKLYLLAEGRLVNLVAANGHPSDVMDMSFANQALVAKWLSERKNEEELENKLHAVPAKIDKKVAERKLGALGIEIDSLSKEQKEYLEKWEYGT
ncbi:S-adenosyl-L-homocysteine hydrolase [candidate division MSBL1 archaeon SCGC-AAA259A05]|uniref:Adenosylhomocysteinase n=1 Tax=candidate division MSBL1 archaeon SCGC-AAA259A05 TaxID=1698259 RepID=A0A133UBF4_9EURY|nr:S-adenosyl-L-homocysteine hydrolase [candidate division MSBL1 archaeon SCGC-AAA259A05]